jgi:hypothetical protein
MRGGWIGGGWVVAALAWQVCSSGELRGQATRPDPRQGWIHIESTRIGQLPVNPDGWLRPNVELPTLQKESSHLHLPTKRYIQDQQWSDGRIVRLYDGREGTITEYRSATNRVRIGWMQAHEREDLQRHHEMRLTLAEAAQGTEATLGRPPATMQRTVEGELVRVETVLFANEEEREAWQKVHRHYFGSNTSLAWARADGFIVRSRAGPMEWTYTYGALEIRDLRDLDVPRDAPVSDARPTGELRALMERLDQRAAAGPGNHVALLSWEFFDKNVSVSGKLQLKGVDGPRWMSALYTWFGPDGAGVAGLPRKPLKWSSLEVADALVLLKEAIPLDYSVGDGQRAWTAGPGAEGLLTAPRPLAARYHAQSRAAADALHHERVTRERLQVGNLGVKAGLVKDAARPNLVGVRTGWSEEISFNGRPPRGESVMTWWLDPARDDLPVETEYVYHETAGIPSSRTRTTFLQIEQLPGGAWYPVHWREERTNLTSGDISVEESRLQILRDIELEDSWFAPLYPGRD